MATRIRITKSGVETFEVPDAPTTVVFDDGDEANHARAFRLEHRARFGDHVQPLRLENGDGPALEIGVKSLAPVEFFEVGVLMAAGGFTLHDLTNAGAQALFYAALFYVGVCEYDDGDARYFGSFEEARAWFAEPGFIEIPLLLRDVLLERNPLLKKVVAPDGLEILLLSGAFSMP